MDSLWAIATLVVMALALWFAWMHGYDKGWDRGYLKACEDHLTFSRNHGKIKV